MTARKITLVLFELAYFKVTVQYLSNYATGTPFMNKINQIIKKNIFSQEIGDGNVFYKNVQSSFNTENFIKVFGCYF